MDDYLHAAKVGRHSAVELTQSYLKGYAVTWWRIVKQEEGKCRNPTLAKCGGEAQHLEKLEVGSLPGLPNV
jgi:hypothetical protein